MGNNLKKDRIAKLQKEVVRSHPRMFTANLGRYPKSAGHELHTDRKARCGDSDMVYVSHYAPKLGLGRLLGKALSRCMLQT